MTRSRRGPGHRLRPGPRPVILEVLENEVAVVLCPCPQLSQAHVSVLFGVGSRHESAEENGLTHTVEHMLFRGTASYREATALNRAAEEIGGFLEGATYRDHLYLGTGCHPSGVRAAIGILGELVSTPRYQGLEIERSILREELLETVDRDGRMIDSDNIAHRAVFGKHGLGNPIEGTLQNLDQVTLAHLESHRRRYLVGRNAVVCVAGPIAPLPILARVRRSFASLPAGQSPLVTAPPPPKPEPVLRYVRDASSQVEIRLSFRAVPIHDPGFPALVMLGRILGDGLASRMNAELVDRRGLAYSLHAGLTRYADCGLFDFDVAVAPNRAARAVSAILEFAAAASRFRYTPAEMDRACRRHRYSMEFRSDSVADLSVWHGSATLFGIRSQAEALGGQLVRVDANQIRDAARRVFQRRGLVITAAGELTRGEWGRVKRVVEGWQL